MINESYKELLNSKNIIRVLSETGTEIGRRIGFENVFDFSLGNPSVPVPDEFEELLIKLIREKGKSGLHSYTQSQGDPEARRLLAESLKERFGLEYTGEHIFMTTGAAGAIAHALRAVTKEGDTVLTIAPYFSEYRAYVEHAGRRLKVVPADTKSFQVDFEGFFDCLTEDVMAVIINTPNNPSGAVYSEETLKKLSDIMREKEKEYGHDIFLISDEPYREIVFSGIKAPYPAAFYDNTLTCYSYSKSLSIPGERIGYVAVNPKARDAEYISPMCGQISRGLGHNCPPSIFQWAIALCGDMTSDLSIYETNMNILYDGLTDMGYEIVKPGGTFYMLPKSPIPDANEFCKKALEENLVLVPADNFLAKGYFRIAYCVETDKVERSLDAFRKLKNKL